MCECMSGEGMVHEIDRAPAPRPFDTRNLTLCGRVRTRSKNWKDSRVKEQTFSPFGRGDTLPKHS